MDLAFSVNDGNVSWGPTGSTVHMRPNDIWRRDDPFVTARPELFSATPLRLHSTQGIEAPPATPIPAPVETVDPELVEPELVKTTRGRRA